MNSPVITLVGCGFVGSVFTTEFLKRMFAGKLPYDLRFIDNDVVEERNSANQNFNLTDQGRAKAEVMSDRALQNGRSAEYHKQRLTLDNMEELLQDSVLVVDGVDNLATRQLLWSYAHQREVPVLHIGIAEMGTGRVDWSHPKHDTFALAPHRTVGRTIVDPQSGVTPPCELARMRGVGLNVGFAAAMAAAIYLGFDPEAHLSGEPTFGYLTEWGATPMSHFPIKETWDRIGEPDLGG